MTEPFTSPLVSNGTGSEMTPGDSTRNQRPENIQQKSGKDDQLLHHRIAALRESKMDVLIDLGYISCRKYYKNVDFLKADSKEKVEIIKFSNKRAFYSNVDVAT